ncbi:hypothetical protein SUDANB171_03118 [Streptomyces sp. enrichment culture]
MSEEEHSETTTNEPPQGGIGHRPRSDRYRTLAHLSTENVLLYRAVMGVFVRAEAEFSVHLRPEGVHAGLPEHDRPPVESVTTALDRLTDWGNLRADPDTGRVTAVEDFYRCRHIYQLTHAGKAAEEALRAYDKALGRRREHQAVASLAGPSKTPPRGPGGKRSGSNCAWVRARPHHWAPETPPPPRDARYVSCTNTYLPHPDSERRRPWRRPGKSGRCRTSPVIRHVTGWPAGR